MNKLKYLLYFVSCSINLFAKESSFINPITDVCWECLFPITISGANVTPETKDFSKNTSLYCFCAGTPPKAGIPMTFWEPAKLVDVTRHAYKLVALGGVSVGEESIKNRGSIGLMGNEGGSQNSFYHVHWYHFPVLKLLELFTDFSCTEKESMDICYMSELDPLWNDDQWSFIINAEAALFSSPIAQLACM